MSVTDGPLTGPLSDDHPVLLGPVRLETRFTDTELLVRIFPDEWAIDKFEPKPTAAEIAALDAYWIALWRSGGGAVAEEAAWQELARRIPAGRANWLLQGHRPADMGARPTGVAAGTTVLVIVSNQPLPANDRQPAITYWTAVWRAHGDREAVGAAFVALRTAVGNTRAQAIRARRPVGVDAPPPGAGDDVVVSFLVLPVAADVAAQSWTKAARARLLPDRFVVLGFEGGEQVVSVTGTPVPDTLPVSPDPEAADQLKVDERSGSLHVPDELGWLTDLDRAVATGMAVRIPLTDRIRGGLDRLVVLGLRQRSGPEETGAELADLITRQLRGPSGFMLVPQGTPTNNSEAAPAGQNAREEAEAGLRTAAGIGLTAEPGLQDEWATRTDGEWLAELLGIDPAALAGTPNADRTDQRDAKAANIALWPATWGSYLRTMLHPIVPPDMVDKTRAFFTRYVSGRGPLPVVKIGRQPYGIVPATAYSRMSLPPGHRRGLKRVLDAAAQDWRAAATAHVAHLDKDDDPHQVLLDILALHPTSAEYHQRYAQSVEDVYNRENLAGGGPRVLPALDRLDMPRPIRALLARLGHTGQDPDLVRRLFVGTQHPLLGPLVDDRPPSETDPVRAYLPGGGNYLQWLAAHAGTDLETIRLESGFAGDRRPAALLYLLLRHAVLLGWEDAGRRLAALAGSPVPSPVDPLFVHVRGGAPSESRFRQLYSPDQAITGLPDRLVREHIPAVLGTAGPQGQAIAQLGEQVRALGLLAGLPTARLERVLAEHLDCAAYRMDAWMLGLATERLTELRRPGGTGVRRGVHVGAYGWLEDVRPRPKPLRPVTLTGDLAALFGPTVWHDPANGGYVHAHSPAQATTAAVLRAGYLANATPETPGMFAVNLSSERVRVALSLLDGLRQGQSLGALLGYRFERGLHDRFEDVELDTFITALRGAFPLRAGRLPGAKPDQDTAVELVEARNVVDGLALVRRITRTPGAAHYPFGAEGLPDVESQAQQDAIDAEALRLLDTHDALADLAVAEGTYQALAGNPERASATLDAYAKEGLPPDPAVVRTPRGGVTLTHRLAVQFRPGRGPGPGDTPRGKAEPAIEDWLPSLLPDDDKVAALVTWTDPVDGDAESRVVTQRDCGLGAIDLLYALRPASEAAMTDLDDRIVGVVIDRDHPRPDAVLTIRYTQRVPGRVTFFELSQLIAALRTLLTTSRPVRPSDLTPAAGAETVDRAADDAVSLPRSRPAEVREALRRLADDVGDYVEDLARVFPEPPAPVRRGDAIEGIDTFLSRYATLVARAGGFGMVRSGWGEVAAWRQGVFTEVLAAADTVADRLAKALDEADELISAYDALPQSASDTERFLLLQKAERLLTTRPTSPLPDRPRRLRTILDDRRRDFARRLDDVRDVARTNRRSLSGLLDEVADLLPLTDVDPAGLDLRPYEDRAVAYGAELLGRARALAAEIDGRVESSGKALDAYDKAVTGPEKVQAAMEALKALLGEDVLAVPEFTPAQRLAQDWRRAHDDSDDLVEHLEDDFGREFPVDDWLHGVARVRDRARLWEQVTLLSDALRGPGDGLMGNHDGWDEPALTPIQLPYRQRDHWLGMEFAEGATFGEDRVLFTAHYADDDFIEDGAACGLLLDEWTEVVPAERETTSIALNHDRPDSEPPQAMLLVAPPVKTGAWRWEDLVAAVGETFDLARSRAVEPAHLDGTAYAHLLPATVLSATRRPITISTDLAVNNLRGREG
ncbi:hypothetical protein SAMN05444920_101725 [Nonomuraea solani]|uniref:Uncharacterized protein n=1 Tax=Nonomuraea solani TaxID=1144553 RepID=A0A1H5V1A7_9ACTN|nr:hypothetical protein [Nonomuraea solani]SEF80950.1 hypothetical protein SAMN05444920_101725 [Nonomuraea solani]